MPIARATEEAVTTLKPNIPKIAEPEYKGVVVDTKYTPLGSLITHIPGASWTVDYFSQVIDKDNDLRGQDSGQSAIYQQYTLIKGMELKVTTGLGTTQNPEDARMATTGTANIYPIMIPNVGDMFAADVGDGREGVFKIKSLTQNSYLKQATYTVEYELFYFSIIETGRRRDLDSKVIKTVHFQKDFITSGQNPLLISDDFYAIEELSDKFDEISRNYLNWFYSEEYNTLLVPGQDLPTYDAYVTETILAIVGNAQAPQVQFIRRLNIDGDIYLKQPQLWKALVHRDKSLLELSNKKMGLINVRRLGSDPLMEGIAFSGIKYLVYPTDPDTTLNNALSKLKLEVEPENILPVSGRLGNLNNIITQPVLTKTDSLPAIKPVNAADAYVLSSAFYDKTSDRSTLELLVGDYFDRKVIDPVVLLKLTLTYANWGGLERFYYLPIVLILIRSVIKNT